MCLLSFLCPHIECIDVVLSPHNNISSIFINQPKPQTSSEANQETKLKLLLNRLSYKLATKYYIASTIYVRLLLVRLKN